MQDVWEGAPVNEWFMNLKPGTVLKWGGVVFAYCIAILIVISIVLSMFGVYG